MGSETRLLWPKIIGILESLTIATHLTSTLFNLPTTPFSLQSCGAEGEKKNKEVLYVPPQKYLQYTQRNTECCSYVILDSWNQTDQF